MLTIVSHTGCNSDEAIEALRKEGSDVVKRRRHVSHGGMKREKEMGESNRERCWL